MSGAEAALTAARLDDEIVHGWGLLGMVAGAIIGAVVAAAIIAGTVASGGLLLFAIIGGCIAGGGLAGGALARGISKAADLPGPTTGRLAGGSPDVTVNSRAAMRAGVDYADGCTGDPINHFFMYFNVPIAEGSKTVTVNGKPMARLSMKMKCGAKIKTGSRNVTVGGPTARVLTVIDNEAFVEGVLEILGFAALFAGIGAAFAAGAGAGLIFIGITGASMVGMKELHSWGESLGPGYGDIMVGVAGFVMLGLGPKMARYGRASRSGRINPKGTRTAREETFIEVSTKAKELYIKSKNRETSDTLYEDLIRADTEVSAKVNELYSRGKLEQALDIYYEDLIRAKTGGRSEIINGREIDAVTDYALIQAKRSYSALDKPKNFLNKPTRAQIKATVDFANQQGKSAEFWFAYDASPEVRNYIVSKGGVFITGLGDQ